MFDKSAIFLGVLIGTSVWSGGRPAEADTSGQSAPAGAKGNGDSSGIWRTPQHDAVNCLYLLLRLSDRQIEYTDVKESLRASEGQVSFAELRDAAGSLGQATELYQCGPDDLAGDRLPVISLIENPTGRGGVFVLLIGFDGSQWHYINGATATIEEMPIDDFRRHWSGCFLARRSGGNMWAMSIGGGMLVIVGYWWLRVRPSSNRSHVGHSSNVHPQVSK